MLNAESSYHHYSVSTYSLILVVRVLWFSLYRSCTSVIRFVFLLSNTNINSDVFLIPDPVCLLLISYLVLHVYLVSCHLFNDWSQQVLVVDSLRFSAWMTTLSLNSINAAFSVPPICTSFISCSYLTVLAKSSVCCRKVVISSS